MRKLVVTEFMSLDGVIENPAWTFPYWNDEIAQFKSEETSASDALLLGRVTYEGFAASWPQRGSADGGDYFNGVRKYVVTSTLDRLEWNNSVMVKGDLVEEINKIKQSEGTNITVHGSVSLVQALLQHHLVDTLRLLMYPVVLGTGKRMFDDGMTAKFNLVESRSLNKGVVALIYEPVRS